MSVNHGRAHVFVGRPAERGTALFGYEAAVERGSGEGVPERMARHEG